MIPPPLISAGRFVTVEGLLHIFLPPALGLPGLLRWPGGVSEAIVVVLRHTRLAGWTVVVCLPLQSRAPDQARGGVGWGVGGGWVARPGAECGGA
jgi:hypothetical protein